MELGVGNSSGGHSEAYFVLFPQNYLLYILSTSPMEHSSLQQSQVINLNFTGPSVVVWKLTISDASSERLWFSALLCKRVIVWLAGDGKVDTWHCLHLQHDSVQVYPSPYMCVRWNSLASTGSRKWRLKFITLYDPKCWFVADFLGKGAFKDTESTV